MKKKSPLLWLIPLILLLLVIPFIVPSALPVAGAEETDLPVYAPVELANPHPAPLLPLPSAREPNPTPYKANPDGFVYDSDGIAWEYRDGTLYVKIETRVINDTKVLFTWVQVADPSQIRTIITGETNPVKLTKKINAVLSINGDWYSGRREGAIYRNGVEMRKPSDYGNYDTLIIDDEGNFHILRRPARDALAPYEGHILHTFMFGPGLVINGELMTSDEDTFVRNLYGSGPGMGLQNLTQRQALCQMGPLSYLIITTEGPRKDPYKKEGGFTGAQLAQLAYDLGAVNAYNMDGGNSACLTFNNVKMNRLGQGGIREITDLVYFITAEEPPAPTEVPTEVPTEAPVAEGSVEP